MMRFPAESNAILQWSCLQNTIPTISAVKVKREVYFQLYLSLTVKLLLTLRKPILKVVVLCYGRESKKWY